MRTRVRLIHTSRASASWGHMVTGVNHLEVVYFIFILISASELTNKGTFTTATFKYLIHFKLEVQGNLP